MCLQVAALQKPAKVSGEGGVTPGVEPQSPSELLSWTFFDGMFQQTGNVLHAPYLVPPLSGAVRATASRVLQLKVGTGFCAEHIVCLRVAALQKPAKVSSEGVSHQGAALYIKCL